jgi:hypothetical protein
MNYLMAAFLVLVGAIACGAQDTLAHRSIVQPKQQPNTVLKKNRIRHLPAAIRYSLTAPKYEGWAIDEAYESLVTDPQWPNSASLLIYVIDLKRNDERATIKFNEEGERLD